MIAPQGKRRNSREAIWSCGAAVVVAVLLLAGSVMARTPADVLRCPDYVIREGQVVEIGDTTITIREWAGTYTYRFADTERWRLEANEIRPGDKVRFLACQAGEFAKDFRKMERE